MSVYKRTFKQRLVSYRIVSYAKTMKAISADQSGFAIGYSPRRRGSGHSSTITMRSSIIVISIQFYDRPRYGPANGLTYAH